MTTVLLEKNAHLATITLNRPNDMNGYNQDMADDLLTLTENVRLDENINIVLFKGAGPVFMAGGDIKLFKKLMPELPQGVLPIARKLAATIHNFQQMQKIVLCSVHGAVAGAAISLMLASDLVIASDNTQFTTAFTGIGTTPDGGLSYFLPRHVGSKKAMSLLLYANRFQAKSALDMNLINEVVPANALESIVNERVEQLLLLPQKALARTKRLVNEAWSNSLSEQLELEAQSFLESTKTRDFEQGVDAFLNKRAPVFNEG
jgi:2-(1,2-epoxy-1,2-dihydrophenyl)acetyl-CoA isomerase